MFWLCYAFKKEKKNYALRSETSQSLVVSAASSRWTLLEGSQMKPGHDRQPPLAAA